MTDTAISFDRAADYYDDTRGFPPGIAPRVGQLFADMGRLDASSRVLEIGIGTGRIALPLAPHVASITGVDLSRKMMDRLRKKPGAESIYLMEGDARQLPFADGTFDAVVIVHVLHLMESWQTAVAELARVLRPDASLMIGWGGRGHQILWREVMSRSQIDREHRRGAKRDYILEYLAGSGGWRENGSQTLDFPFRAAPHELIEQLRDRVWSSSWNYTASEHQRVLASMEEVMLERYGDLNTPVDFPADFSVYAFQPPARHRDT